MCRVAHVKEEIDRIRTQIEEFKRKGDFNKVAELQYGKLPELERKLKDVQDREQKKIAEAYIAQLDAAKAYKHSIVTQVMPYKVFYDAEDYHQNYLVKHPDDGYIRAMDKPKLELLKREFPQFYR